jgi:hypothetical protein
VARLRAGTLPDAVPWVPLAWESLEALLGKK